MVHSEKPKGLPSVIACRYQATAGQPEAFPRDADEPLADGGLGTTAGWLWVYWGWKPHPTDGPIPIYFTKPAQSLERRNGRIASTAQADQSACSRGGAPEQEETP